MEGKEGGELLHRLVRQIDSWAGLSLENILGHHALAKSEGTISLEVMVEAMRKDIEVKVVGAGNAFTISYIGKDPMTVMNVTNTLASLFIEENLKIREQQAEGTTEFLESQLVEAKRQLEIQETALKDFKERRMGSLPGQMDANLRTLDRLQLELQTTNDTLKSTEERKLVLKKLKFEIQNITDPLRSGGEQTLTVPIWASPERQAAVLIRLKEELSRLQAEFNDNYPDVVRLKRQIREAEENAGGMEMSLPAGGPPRPPVAQGDSSQAQHLNPYFSELLTIDSEIESLKRRRERIVGHIKQYEKRVEDTFTNEQNFLNLTRDYEISQRNYQGLLDKRISAKISENLEKRQKAEQFRILDPANLPQKPYKPDRTKIVLLGSLLSGGLGGGLILLREYLGPSYRRPEDFQGVVDIPMLATIPRTKITRKEEPPLITLQEPDSWIAEQYRLLYTRIEQTNQGRQHGILAISSSIQGEGKTITTLNLALVSARDFGKKTLVIEADLKSPKIVAYIQCNSSVGLVELLTNNINSLPFDMLEFGNKNLSILPVVKSIKNSSGILSSSRMKDLLSLLKENYEVILLDSPPILALPDMNIIESLSNGVILVVRAERTRREVVKMAIESLNRDKIVGITFNDVQESTSRYYRYDYLKS